MVFVVTAQRQVAKWEEVEGYITLSSNLEKLKLRGKGCPTIGLHSFNVEKKNSWHPGIPFSIFLPPTFHLSSHSLSPPPPDSCQKYTSMHVLLIGRSIFLLFLQSNPHILGDHWSTEDLTPILKIKKRGKK